MEIHRITSSSLGFGMTHLSASYNLFLTSVLTSVFNLQAPILQALELETKSTRTEDETGDPVDEIKKRKNIFTRSFIIPLRLFPLFH